MTPLVLDTHVWVWWVTRPEKLSRAQRGAIERARRRGSGSLLLSIISCWEVALLGQRGRLRFSLPIDTWLDRAASLPGLEIVPLSLPVIQTAVRLVELRDPADQFIVATAQHRAARVVTSDERIATTGAVAVVA